MKRTFLAAFVLASICACYGGTSGNTDVLGPDGGGGVIPGDGGTDGGDGGSDAGTDGGPDAGCIAMSLNGVGAIDNCVGAPNAVASVTVSTPAQGCAVSITLNTASTPCTGVASNGTLDAFDGGCAGIGYTCTSPSLPGTLTCTYPGQNLCTIRICDAGTCGP
ncbi:MAG TPA: hypothetical protein VEP66_16275 [Myxococcales bacterium]|nr:hypothetical protein [Myxococcales bacterium]